MKLNKLVYPAPKPSMKFDANMKDLLLVDGIQPDIVKQPTNLSCVGCTVPAFNIMFK